MVRKVTIKVAPLFHPYSLHMCLENHVFHLLSKSWIFTAFVHRVNVGKKSKSSFKEAFQNENEERDKSRKSDSSLLFVISLALKHRLPK